MDYTSDQVSFFKCNSLITYCQHNFSQLSELIEKISPDNYRRPSKMVGGASIGQHMRHILEFYQCLLKGLAVNVVNYDNRDRNHKLETCVKEARLQIELITLQLSSNELPLDDSILVKANLSSKNDDQPLLFQSSVYRELVYCYEHCIHHQALIKVALIEFNLAHYLSKDFGIAPSTIRNQIF